jgi:hypothetical protein
VPSHATTAARIVPKVAFEPPFRALKDSVHLRLTFVVEVAPIRPMQFFCSMI